MKNGSAFPSVSRSLLRDVYKIKRDYKTAWKTRRESHMMPITSIRE